VFRVGGGGALINFCRRRRRRVILPTAAAARRGVPRFSPAAARRFLRRRRRGATGVGLYLSVCIVQHRTMLLFLVLLAGSASDAGFKTTEAVGRAAEQKCKRPMRRWLR